MISSGEVLSILSALEEDDRTKARGFRDAVPFKSIPLLLRFGSKLLEQSWGLLVNLFIGLTLLREDGAPCFESSC